MFGLFYFPRKWKISQIKPKYFFHFSYSGNGISFKAYDFFFSVHDNSETLSKFQSRFFFFYEIKVYCPFNWKIHIRCRKLWSALFLITVKTCREFHAVVKKMQKTLVTFLYDNAKSHHITTLMHKRLLAETLMNEKPLALWCHSFNGGELGLLRLLAWPRKTGHDKNAKFQMWHGSAVRPHGLHSFQ